MRVFFIVYKKRLEKIMCGIYGYIGKNAVQKSICGLEKLEYRGYDSAGIAYITENEKIKVVKNVGKVLGLKNKLEQEIESNLAIAHTRWATHGKPSILNCHPVSSENFSLVHNGIIENFKEIQNEYNFKLKTETDSEIIVKLIEKNFNKNLENCEKINENILKSIKYAAEKLKGSWAVELICKKMPNKIYIFKNLMPIVVGSNKLESAVASDVNAFEFDEKIKWNYYTLQDGNICELSQDKIVVYNEKLEKIKLNKTKKEKINCKNLTNFKYKMLKEINEIPNSLINTKKSIINSKNSNLINNFSNFSSVSIVGCGTAYHAGLYGKFIFEKLTKKFVNVELASEFRYKTQLKQKNKLVFAISQSGETADTIAALKLAKENGATTAVITNVRGSTITNFADYVFLTNAGPEIAVAATKSYVAQVYALYLLACLISNEKPATNLRAKVMAIIENFDKKILEKYFNCQKFFFIGRLCDSTTALEGALKLKEIAYAHSEGYAAGELKHGTLSLVDENSLIIAIITQSNIKEKTLNAAHEVQARGGKVLFVTQFEDVIGEKILLPKTNENVMPILSIVPLQLLAYYFSISKGLNPDMPRNLAKSVTVE